MSNVTRTADNIRAEMARRRVTQIAVATHLGMSQAAVSRRLNGDKEFAVSELLAVAFLLGVTAIDLLGGDVTDEPVAV